MGAELLHETPTLKFHLGRCTARRRAGSLAAAEVWL
jgi:hypothetical protein